MKKLILILGVFLILSSCEKNEEITPINNFDVTIDLKGAFMFKYVSDGADGFLVELSDTLSYQLSIEVNDFNHIYNINKVIQSGFSGSIHKKTISINKNDKLIISIRDNVYPSDSYIYMDVYTNKNIRSKLQFQEYKEVRVLFSGQKNEYISFE